MTMCLDCRRDELASARLESLKCDSLQAVLFLRNDGGGGLIAQSLNARDGPIEQANQFASEFGITALKQTTLRFVRRKPGWVSIYFLRQFEVRNLAKVNGDGMALVRGRVGLLFTGIRFAAVVARERHFFNAPVNACFLVGLKCSGLGLRKAGFDSTFWESPAAAAGLHQQKLKTAGTGAITDSGDLLTFIPICRSRRRGWLRKLR